MGTARPFCPNLSVCVFFFFLDKRPPPPPPPPLHELSKNENLFLPFDFEKKSSSSSRSNKS